MALIKTNITDAKTIKIVEFLGDPKAEDIIKDDPLGKWKCTVRWCDQDIDTHIAIMDKSLTSVDEIYIFETLKSFLKPGLYKKMPQTTQKELYFFAATAE